MLVDLRTKQVENNVVSSVGSQLVGTVAYVRISTDGQDLDTQPVENGFESVHGQNHGSLAKHLASFYLLSSLGLSHDKVRDVLAAGADEAESMATLPKTMVEALYESGLQSLKLPAKLGGA